MASRVRSSCNLRTGTGLGKVFHRRFLRNKQWVYLPKVKVIQILFISKNFIPFLSEISPNATLRRIGGRMRTVQSRRIRGVATVPGRGAQAVAACDERCLFAVRGRCGCMTGVCDGQERLRFDKGRCAFCASGAAGL